MTRNAWAMSSLMALTLAFVTLVTQTQAQGAASGPTAKGAQSADEAINRALLTGNADALKALLADDWIVVSGFGSVADKDGFVDFIRRSGARKTMILSEARVRLYGDTALVTTHLSAVGPFIKEENGKVVRKCFDVKERQTDVLVWNNGSWKSVLLHETIIPPGAKVTDISSSCT
jgi:ketosteroid isomerase-like protein